MKRARSAVRPVAGDPALALFIAALGLRPAVIGIGPVATAMATDLRVSHAYVALLETIPIICMGLFAPLGPFLAARLGDRATMALGLSVVVVAGSMRAFAPSATGIMLLTVAVGIATGAAGALPAFVGKLRASVSRTGIAAATSATGIVAGATFAAAAAAPVAATLGGWRPTVAFMGLVCLIPLAGWLGLVGPAPSRTPQATRPRGHVWLRPVAWLLALAYGLQGIAYWGANAWLPGAFVEQGWSATSAGTLVALLNGATLLGNLSLIVLSSRVGRRALLVASAAAIGAGAVALTVQPHLAVAWTLLMGLGNGMIYPVLLALTMDVAEDEAAAGAIGAFMLLVGYELSALGPVVLGLVRDAEGSFRLPLVLLAAAGVGVIVPSLALARRTPLAVPGVRPALDVERTG